MELALQTGGGTGDGWIGSLPGWYRIHVEYFMLYCVSYLYPAIYLCCHQFSKCLRKFNTIPGRSGVALLIALH